MEWTSSPAVASESPVAEAAGAAPARPVERTGDYRWLFWTLAIVGLLIDQGSKYGIFALRANQWDGHSVPIYDGAIKFDLVAYLEDRTYPADGKLAFLQTLSTDRVHYVNKGALFGWTGWLPEGSSNLAFAVVSIFAAIAIVWWTSRPGPRGHSYLCFALGLILAGTVGNLYDRIVFGGVRDFLHFYELPLPMGFDNWPVFNIADCFLVVGAGLLLLEAVFASPEEPAKAA